MPEIHNFDGKTAKKRKKNPHAKRVHKNTKRRKKNIKYIHFFVQEIKRVKKKIEN